MERLPIEPSHRRVEDSGDIGLAEGRPGEIEQLEDGINAPVVVSACEGVGQRVVNCELNIHIHVYLTHTSTYAHLWYEVSNFFLLSQ